MIVALIGFAGAVFGAFITLVSATLADRRQARAEARRWRRDQLESAYAQTLRYLLRAANRRSEFEGGTGSAVLLQKDQREWFDDLVEAQVWIRTVVRYCGDAGASRIWQAAEQLDSYVDRLVSGVRYDEKDFSIWKVLQDCIATVTEAARVDRRGGTIPVISRQKEAANAPGDRTQNITMVHAPQSIIMASERRGTRPRV